MQSYNSIQEMIAATATGVRPPERLTVAEAAEKYRYLNNPGSYVGYWDNTFAPYLVEPMEVLTSIEHTGMTFAGPARTGKSDMFFNWLVHTAICDPADMMLVQNTMNVARDWSQKDLRRAFRHSKELGKTVAPGRHNMSTHDIRFLSGMHLVVKWPTISELSGKTVGRNWIADYDRIAKDIDGEGSAYVLTAKRGQTFRQNAMTVAESSPGYDILDPKWSPVGKGHEAPPCEGGVLPLYNSGDRRRWYWRCPHCTEAFEPDFKLLVIPDSADTREAGEATVMGCPHCGGVIHHDGHNGDPGKHELNQIDLGNAKWVKEGQIWTPRTATAQEVLEGIARQRNMASFWLKGPAASFATWAEIVTKYLDAMEEFERTGAQETLKGVINTDFGLPYLLKGLENGRTPEEIREQAVDLPLREVPVGVNFLVAAIDVQKHRFEVQVMGFGRGGDITVIDRFDIKKSSRLDEDGEREYVEPGAYQEDWDLLIHQVMLKTYPLGDGSGMQMRISMTGCDSGGAARKGENRKHDNSTTRNAYGFYRRLRKSDGTEFPEGLHRRFRLLKGGSTPSAPRVKISYPDSERKDRNAGARGDIPVLMLNTLALKDMLDVMLDRKTTAGGRVRLPDGLPETFWSEMCAEVRTPSGWEKVTSRNEAWDLLVYAIALSIYKPIFIERFNWDAPPKWAAPWWDGEANSMVFNPMKPSSATAEEKPKKRTLSDLAAALA